MPSDLTAVREELASALTEAGFRAVSEVPESFTPPLCWVAPRQPYRQPGKTFGRKRVSLAVVCLASHVLNGAALAEVDDLATNVADAIDAMTNFRLETDEIDAPQMFPATQNQSFLGAVVNVWTEVARA